MTTRHQFEYQHIRYVLLADTESSDIDHLLHGEGMTNLRRLKVFVRRPGLELGGITFANEDGNDSTLSEEHVGELKAVESFLNYLQNWYGPPTVAGLVDITTTTRDDFLSFIDQHSDQHTNLEDNPVHLTLIS